MSATTICLSAGGVTAEVCPERGAILARLVVGGRDVLYLDRATLDDPGKNVRGGVPVLFPFAGKLEGDRFLPAGTTMKQHGFGRNVAWAVVDKRDDALRMQLDANDTTRAQYPYAFVVSHTVRLLPRGVELELLVENRGDHALPLSPGWHPYFNCPAPQKKELAADVAGFTSGQVGDDREFDFGLPAPPSGRARFVVPSLGRLSLESSPEMRHLQFWSQPGKPFVCLEPFFGPAGTVNGERADVLAAGRCRAYWTRIELLD